MSGKNMAIRRTGAEVVKALVLQDSVVLLLSALIALMMLYSGADGGAVPGRNPFLATCAIFTTIKLTGNALLVLAVWLEEEDEDGE